MRRRWGYCEKGSRTKTWNIMSHGISIEIVHAEEKWFVRCPLLRLEDQIDPDSIENAQMLALELVQDRLDKVQLWLNNCKRYTLGETRSRSDT